MSADEDLYLNQTDADALFFSDALLGNADEIDFESFGDASGLDDGTFNGITGPSLTTFETQDIFKATGLNGESFVDEVEAKCESNSTIQQEPIVTTNNGTSANAAASASAGIYSTSGTYANEGSYVFNKPTLDLEGLGMAYGISGLYLQGNGLGSPSSPLLSPSVVASEKLNGLSLGQMAPSYGMQPSFSRGGSTKAVYVASPTSPVLKKSQSMTRFGSQEMLMVDGNGCLSQSSSPGVLSPNSSDGKEQVDVLGENGMKLAQEQKQYYGVLQPERSVDSTTSFIDQVDGDGDGLQPLPQMTRPSMQRSYSSHALGQLRHNAPAPPLSESRMNSRPSQVDSSGGMTSPGARLQPNMAEIRSMGMRPMMRRVYSAGDIQTLNGMQGNLSGGASPSFDEGNYRVGKYSMEERKIRIHRYQQKRTQRNFNKKIKYACRKTLADSRPRVRGRFAKNMDDDLPTAILTRSKREDDDEEEGDAHANGGEANGYHFDNSSGEYSDMLKHIKVEHRVNSM